MKKEKIIMSITIGLMCFVLSTVMFMQFKTIKATDITAIKNMRETELRTEITTWRNKYEEISKKYEEVVLKRDEYKTTREQNLEATELLEKELKQANMLLRKNRC